MISRITGAVEQRLENAVVLRVGGLSYEVWVPSAVLQTMDGAMAKHSEVTLVTFHYHQTDPSKSITSS